MGKEENHLRMQIEDATGRVAAVVFRVAGTALGQAIEEAADGRPVDVLGCIRRNRFNGSETAQFHLLDLAAAGMAE